MANRSYHRIAGALELESVMLWAQVTIGGTGAPTLSRGKGIASVTRNSAGQYKLTLQDAYVLLLDAHVTILDTNSSDPSSVGCLGRVKSQDVANVTAPTVTMQMFASDDGAAADPASGAVLLIKLELKNSSVD